MHAPASPRDNRTGLRARDLAGAPPRDRRCVAGPAAFRGAPRALDDDWLDPPGGDDRTLLPRARTPSGHTRRVRPAPIGSPASRSLRELPDARAPKARSASDAQWRAT